MNSPNQIESSPNAPETMLFPVGTLENNTVLYRDVLTIPHMLVCGTTGTGKTSFVQTLLHYLVTHYSYDELGLILYNSKYSEYNDFIGIPHLLAPIVTEDTKLQIVMNWLDNECKKRLKTMAEVGAKDISSYNSNNASTGAAPLKSIFCILDDFSMAFDIRSLPTEFSTVLSSGRSVGIHLIVVTSAPLPSSFLSSIPCRVAFRLLSKKDSRSILDRDGAEQLQVPGEIIFRSQGVYAQCRASFTPPEEIRQSLQELKKDVVPSPSVIPDSPVVELNDSETEEFLEQVIQYVVEKQSASISMLQRTFRIGFNRAVRLLDALEERGIVGPDEGSQPRKVLVTADMLDAVTAEEPQTKVRVDEPEIAPLKLRLRDYPWLSVGGYSISISDDVIYLKTRITAPSIVKSTTIKIHYTYIDSLSYKVPHLLSKGYIQFNLNDYDAFLFENRTLQGFDRSFVEKLLRIEFKKPEAQLISSFVNQVAEDNIFPVI